MQNLTKAVEIVGGAKQMADKLGVSYPSVWAWLNSTRKLPAEHCPSIEKLTNGQVRCEDLRCDVDWSVLRTTKIVPNPKKTTTQKQVFALPEVGAGKTATKRKTPHC